MPDPGNRARAKAATFSKALTTTKHCAKTGTRTSTKAPTAAESATAETPTHLHPRGTGDFAVRVWPSNRKRGGSL